MARGARHDLGLYEAIFTFVIWGVILVMWRFNPRRCFIGGVICTLYSVGRFPMDYLRATDLERSDARYFDLTPAQYGCIALFALGIYFFYKAKSMPRGIPEETAPA